MTFLRDIAAARIERPFAALARVPLKDAALLALIVAAMVFPLIAIRGYHYEEGLTAALARDALSGSPWYVPDLFGVRWIERPVMQSWLVAAISLPLGGVSQVSTRLPTVAALFGTALLIVWLLRGRVSRLAALVAALSFLFSPAVLSRVVTAEADVLLSALQFAAFAVWWKGCEAGRIGLARWAAVGLLLAATALCKGPQPAAFFALGVAAFILVERAWRQLPGYALAGIVSLGITGAWYAAVVQPSDFWKLIGYMRLAGALNGDYLGERIEFVAGLLAFLPGPLLALPSLFAWLSRREPADIAPADRRLFLALVLYAGVAGTVLALWPGGGAARYALPALPALAALGGLAFDRLSIRLPALSRLALVVLSGLVVYQLAWNWIAAPGFSDSFSRSRMRAAIVEAAAADASHVIYAPIRLDDGLLAYLDRPVRYLRESELKTLPPRSYFLAPEAVAGRLSAERKDVTFVLHAVVGSGTGFYEVRPR